MNTVKANIKYFFKQSLKSRKKNDYGELFARGFSDNNELNKVYPWFYLRVLAAMTAVFAIYALAAAFSNALTMIKLTLFFTGGAFFDAAFLILLFELYPYRDLSLLKLICICLVGGAASDALVAAIYYPLWFELNGWTLAVTAGVGEEVAKAVPAIVCIIIFRKKNNPVAGFLIGAAVGTWFSLTENAAYIWNSSNYRILTAVARGVGAPFSHAAWTALISWAYCKFRRPFINIKFYAVTLFCMAMHFSIDMPLWDCIPLLFSEAALCGLLTFIFSAIVIYKERKIAFKDTERVEESIPPFTALHKANITAGAFGAVLCVLLLLLAAVFSKVSYTKTVFDNEQDFIDYAHNGYEISHKYYREYDSEYENYFAQYEKGVLTTAEQLVPAEGFSYLYCYALRDVYPEVNTPDEVEDSVGGEADNKVGNDTADDGEGSDSGEDSVDGEDSVGGETVPEKKMQLSRVDVIIETDGEEVRYYETGALHLENGSNIADYVVYFYRINPELKGVSVELENGKVTLYKYEERLTLTTIIVLSVTCAVAAAGVCTYAVMRSKAKGK